MRERRHITADGAPPRRNPNPPPRNVPRLCSSCGGDKHVQDVGGADPKKRMRCRKCIRAQIARGLPTTDAAAASVARDPFARMED